MAKKRQFGRRRYFRKPKRRGGKDRRFPIFTGIGVGVGLANFATHQSGYGVPTYELQTGNYEGALKGLGENAKWAFLTLDGWLNVLAPPIIGAFGSKAMTAVGANKAMKRVPFVGRYIKL